VPAAAFLVAFLMLYHLFRAQQLAEARLYEEQAKHFAASKLSALGEMAGGVAHEINNPLAAIQLLATQISARSSGALLDQAEPIRRAAKNIEDTVQRVAKVTRAMQLLARTGAVNGGPVATPLHDLLESVALLCQEKCRSEGIQFEHRPAPQTLSIECEPAQISHILLSLLQNAIDALKNQPRAAVIPWIRLESADLGSHVKISVTDSGPPIPNPLRERIFDPFFTTKDLGQGLGLGLSVSAAIAQAHGGELSLDPSSAHPTFHLILPKRFSSGYAGVPGDTTGLGHTASEPAPPPLGQGPGHAQGPRNPS
jgi:C4-dicarboxylate-specific signal transduction histidine kinase